MSVTLISGKNRFELEKARKKALANGARLFDGASLELQDFVSSVTNSSLFDTDSSDVVVAGPSANPLLTDWVVDNIAQLHSADTKILLVAPDIDKRSVFYKTMKKEAEVVATTVLKPFEVERWLLDYAKDHDVDIDRKAVAHLVKRIGTDQMRLASEVQKLGLLDTVITSAVVDEHTAMRPEDNIFTLLEMVFAAKAKKAVEYYESLDRGASEPLYVVSMFYWQLNNVAIVKAAKDRTDGEIAKDNKMSPYVVSKSRGLASKITKAQLIGMYDAVIDAEKQLKSTVSEQRLYMRALIHQITELIQ